jgi:uncharacterized membrane protein YeaQ/YmgE (transglycosylase-associated protein family)
MELLSWFTLASVTGWLASLVVGTNARIGTMTNTVTGIFGASVGGWFVAPMIPGQPIDRLDVDMASLLISFVCAVATIAAVNILQGIRPR